MQLILASNICSFLKKTNIFNVYKKTVALSEHIFFFLKSASRKKRVNIITSKLFKTSVVYAHPFLPLKINVW